MEGHKAIVKYSQIKSNLVNLPSNLSNLLFNANINPQDVIVEIVIQKSKLKYYAGWTALSSGHVQNIEVDPVFAQALSIPDSEAVTINLKIQYYETTQIMLEPETTADWELVELHAQTIEDKLLSQTRCVSLSQPMIVYPSKTTSAKLIVTDIGSKDHQFAKISPYCEIQIAPKVKQKKAPANVSKPTAKVRPTEDYSNLPPVLKRGISLPHSLFRNSNTLQSYEIYINFKDLPAAMISDYIAVSIVPGPNEKSKTSPVNEEPQENDKSKIQSLKETKRVVARLVNYSKGPQNTVGLSESLAIALNVEHQVGCIVVLKTAVKLSPKRPSAFTIHPYITQTKRNSQMNLNSTTKKDQDSKILEILTGKLYDANCPISKTPITNGLKLPIIPDILPNGGLLKFKKSTDSNAWVKPYNNSSKKPIKIELGEELLRNASFVQQVEVKDASKAEAIGLDATVDDIVDSLVTSRNTGTLVYGNSGSGKSLILKLVADKISSDYGYHTKFVSCESLMNENFNSLSKNHVFKWLQNCSWHKPSILILDNLDKLLSAEVEHGDSSKSIQLTEYLISQLEKIQNQHNSNLSLLMSAASKEALNKLLFQCHLIEHFHHLSPPDKGARAEILEVYLTQKLGCGVDFDIMDMVTETEGYLPNDLKILSDRLYHDALFNKASDESEKLVATKQNLEKALEGYTPSNLRGVKLQKSSINWSDIGGLKDAKNILLETLEWPTKYAPIFASCPLRLRSGILLYGYPGCGKTLLASAVAGQCGLNFISIKGPEILNKYIGASEQSVRELFERAQAAKPCILFFDEFDSIAPKRGHDSTGVTDRVVNQMLTQMDGAEGLDGVYVLAATSRPDLIDSALLRPGRLDKSVICDMPSFEDRLDILRSITAKMYLEADVDLNAIAEATVGFSGADMQGLGYNAYLKAVHIKLAEQEEKASHHTSTKDDKDVVEFFQINSEKIKNKKLRSADRIKIVQQIQQMFEKNETNEEEEDLDKIKDDNALKVYITQDNFNESLKETKPSISMSEKRKLEKVYSQFVSSRDGNMPDGSTSNEIGGRTTLM